MNFHGHTHTHFTQLITGFSKMLHNEANEPRVKRQKMVLNLEFDCEYNAISS